MVQVKTAGHIHSVTPHPAPVPCPWHLCPACGTCALPAAPVHCPRHLCPACSTYALPAVPVSCPWHLCPARGTCALPAAPVPCPRHLCSAPGTCALPVAPVPCPLCPARGTCALHPAPVSCPRHLCPAPGTCALPAAPVPCTRHLCPARGTCALPAVPCPRHLCPAPGTCALPAAPVPCTQPREKPERMSRRTAMLSRAYLWTTGEGDWHFLYTLFLLCVYSFIKSIGAQGWGGAFTQTGMLKGWKEPQACGDCPLQSPSCSHLMQDSLLKYTRCPRVSSESPRLGSSRPFTI